MSKFLVRFARNSSGAVTVDWVVLTGAIIGLAIMAFPTIYNSTVTLADHTGQTMVANGTH